MTAPKAAKIPIATTVTTVRESTKAPNRLPKFGPPSDELPQPRVQFFSISARCRWRIFNLPALTLAAVSK